jgi:hypothetical protein
MSGFRMTAKYKSALILARRIGLPELDNEPLYQALADRDYFYNSQDEQWTVAPKEDADPPSKVIHLRVWADGEVVDDMATDIANMMEAGGFDLQEKSKLYPCRPPKNRDARVYLTFALPEKKHGSA